LPLRLKEYVGPVDAYTDGAAATARHMEADVTSEQRAQPDIKEIAKAAAERLGRLRQAAARLIAGAPAPAAVPVLAPVRARPPAGRRPRW
jgi:hypothetical protein